MAHVRALLLHGDIQDGLCLEFTRIHEKGTTLLKVAYFIHRAKEGIWRGGECQLSWCVIFGQLCLRTYNTNTDANWLFQSLGNCRLFKNYEQNLFVYLDEDICHSLGCFLRKYLVADEWAASSSIGLLFSQTGYFIWKSSLHNKNNVNSIQFFFSEKDI